MAVVATCLSIGLTAAPSAMAADGKANAGDGSAKAQSAQSRPPSNRQLNTRLNSTRRSLRRTVTDLAALSRRLQTSEGGVRLLLSAAPQLVNGLTTIGTALQTQVVPALTALGTAVQTTIPNAIRDVATSQEYGVAGITVSGPGAVQVGNDTVSPDVPDDGNPAVAKGTALIATGAAGAMQIVLRGKIRSAEDDRGGSQTVGQAGGFLSVKRVDPTAPDDDDGAAGPNFDQAGVLNDCADDNPATAGPGQNQFVLGTTAGETITTPSGNVTNLPLVNLQGGFNRTDTTGVSNGGKSLFPAALPQCTIVAGGAGELYEVDYTVNFVDVPTSTSPGARD